MSLLALWLHRQQLQHYNKTITDVVLPALSSKATADHWIPDSGAMTHVTGRREAFVSIGPPPPNTRILGVGGATAVQGMGTVQLPIVVDGFCKTFSIDNVLYAPDLPFNIISVKKLCLNKDGTPTGIGVDFNGPYCEIIRRSTDQLIARADCLDSDLYTLKLQGSPTTNEKHVYAAKVTNNEDLYTWHRRLGHLKENRLRRLLKRTLGITFPSDLMERCEPCCKATLVRRNYITPGKRATTPLQRVFLDVGGPVSYHKGKAVHRYWLVIVDDYSRYRWVYLMQHKSDVNGFYREWKDWAENHFDCKVGAVRSDNGGEFTNDMLTSLHRATGADVELTAPYNPAQNGVAERSMGILLNAVRSILFDTNLPEYCFGEVLKTVCKLNNYSPTSANGDRCPHEVLFQEDPPLRELRAIGCECWKSLPHNPSMGKIDSRGDKCYLLGYGNGSHQYRVWNSIYKRIELVRDLDWKETLFPDPEVKIPETVHRPAVEDDALIHERINDLSRHKLDDLPSAYSTRSKKRMRFEGENSMSTATLIPTLVTEAGDVNEELRLRDPDIDTQSVTTQIEQLKSEGDGEFVSLIASLICSMERNQGNEWMALPAEIVKSLDLFEPKTYKAAITGADKEIWSVSIKEECDSLEENKTWTVVARPTHQRVLSGKYVFKIKTNSSGQPDRYKARWVARGFEQEYGVDFKETFASVVKPMSYRVLFAIACALNWQIDQMDVKTAFLYGKIDAEVYVELPPNLESKYPANSVCKLNKALYGLKQAPKICIFVHGKERLVIGVYVDDLLIMGENREAIDRLKIKLQTRFKMTDLGPATYYLGIKLTRQWNQWGNKLCLSQKAYIKKILKDFKMEDANGVATPMADVSLAPHEDINYSADPELRKWYQSAVGSLMYLMLSTRPDIAYAVSQLSRFSANPTEKHKVAVKHVLRYLKQTIDYGLVFDSSNKGKGLMGYTDANWARDHDRRSTGGFVFMLFGTIITWSSKRQATVALSSCEAEYIAETEAAKEAIWLRRLLQHFNYLGPITVTIKGDNRGALALAKNPEFHARTKHIDIRYHFVRQKVEEGLVELEWTGTAANIADGMTKPLGRAVFDKFRGEIGMRVISD